MFAPPGSIPRIRICVPEPTRSFRHFPIPQAAMPVALVSIIIARVYGGHPRTAVQIVLGTTALGVFVIPLWLRAGLAWIGV